MEKTLNLSLTEGRLTRDPELVYTKNGSAVCKFDIAINYGRRIGDGEIISEVSFISVNTWNKVADACSKYLKKGSKVRVRGRIKQDSWLSNSGKKQKKVYIEAASVEFLGSPKNKEASQEAV